MSTRSQSNDTTYDWAPPASASVDMLYNGLNQLTQVGSTTISHDPLGNLETGASTLEYGYDLEYRLRYAVVVGTTIGLAYDPPGIPFFRTSREGRVL